MKPLAGILRSRRFYLFGLIVLLPAVFFGVVAVRTFQGEIIRNRYQEQERQQQISRLFENDLNDWLEALYSSESGEGIIGFQIRNGTLLLPELNILVSGRPRDSVPISDLELRPLRRAQALEREGNSAKAAAAYRQLLEGKGQVASLARLSLLRLALTHNQKEDVVNWLTQIREHDKDAFTEAGVPVWVGSALLLISRGRKPKIQGLSKRVISRWTSVNIRLLRAV